MHLFRTTSFAAFLAVAFTGLAAADTLVLEGASGQRALIDPATIEGDLDLYNDGPNRVVITVCNPGADCEEVTVDAKNKLVGIKLAKGARVYAALPAGTRRAEVEWDFP